MYQTGIFVTRSIAALLLATAAVTTAIGAPPAHAGGRGGPPGWAKHADKPGHSGQHGPSYDREHDSALSVNVFFNDYRRGIIRDYYHDLFNTGHCPPGLAKKHNGCLPPGQARKWRLGYRLPDDLIYYGLPRALAVRLGYDDPAYRLIRVGGDILRIAVGSGIVVDALQDLGGLY